MMNLKTLNIRNKIWQINFFELDFHVDFFYESKRVYVFIWSYLDINECDRGTPCGVGNQCTNTIGGHICTCASGYRVSSDAKLCVDIGKNDYSSIVEQVLKASSLKW